MVIVLWHYHDRVYTSYIVIYMYIIVKGPIGINIIWWLYISQKLKGPVKWFQFINIIKVYFTMNYLLTQQIILVHLLSVIFKNKNWKCAHFLGWADITTHDFTHKTANYWIWINIETALGKCFMFFVFVAYMSWTRFIKKPSLPGRSVCQDPGILV